MKQRSRLFGNWVVIVLAFVGLSSLTACYKDLGDDDVMMYTISGNASGAQVSPAGTGTGAIAGTYNQNTNQLTYTINWTGISGTAQGGGIYLGMPGAAGTTNRPLSAGTVTSTANSYTGTIVLNREEE